MKSVVVKLNEHAELLKNLLLQDKDKEALLVYIDCLRTSVSATQSQLGDEREKIQQLQVSSIHRTVAFDLHGIKFLVFFFFLG